MSEWKSLLSGNAKLSSEGYQYVPMEQLLGKTIFVLDFEVFNAGELGGKGVRISFTDGTDTKKFTITYGVAIVDAFNNHADKARELIEKKEPMCIISAVSMSGRSFFTFQ